jgi:hypothetical protein
VRSDAIPDYLFREERGISGRASLVLPRSFSPQFRSEYVNQTRKRTTHVRGQILDSRGGEKW